MAQHGDGDSGEPVVEAADGCHDGGVDVRWQRSGQRVGLAGDVGVEHQAPVGGVGPAPRGDVIEQGAHRYGGMGVDMGADGSGPVDGP